MVLHTEIPVSTTARCMWVDITQRIETVIRQSTITEGICCVASLHTTAGITLNENADPDVQTDFFKKLANLIPKNDSYRHNEGNSDAHLKASLVGLSAHIPVSKGVLILGTWQSVYFCEFDGPRSRTVLVTIVGE